MFLHLFIVRPFSAFSLPSGLPHLPRRLCHSVEGLWCVVSLVSVCLWRSCGMSFPLSLSVCGGIVVCHIPCFCLWRDCGMSFPLSLSVEGLWFVISFVSVCLWRDCGLSFPLSLRSDYGLSFSPVCHIPCLFVWRDCVLSFSVYACGAIAVCHFLCLYLSVDGRGLSYHQSFSVEGLWFVISLVSVCEMIALCHFPFFM